MNRNLIQFTAPSTLLFVALALCVTFAGCATNDSDSNLSTKSTKQSVASQTPLRVWGRMIAYLADEATTGPGGTDFNGDGDVLDSIATVVNIKGKKNYVLGVAARGIHLLDREVYVVANESEDGRDWNGDADQDDRVLLHWSEETEAVAFVDTVDATVPIAAAASDERFYYVAQTSAVAAETTLRAIEETAPLLPVPVPSPDGTPYSPEILKVDEGLLFAGLDEGKEGMDLNGDGDMTDTRILALLDTTVPGANLLPTGLAAPDGLIPLRASAQGTGDWLVAFLVSEAAHGDLTGGGFNDPANFGPAWQPIQCIGHADADLEDDVVHFLRFQAWAADPAANPPVNTGLVGTSRIAIRGDYVATISAEVAEGGCDLNSDGDAVDEIVRWVEAVAPILPYTSPAQLYANQTSLPGGVSGLVELENSFVMAITEAGQNKDLDGDGDKDHVLVAWLDPRDGIGAFWRIDQVDGPGVGFVGTDWMNETPKRNYVLTTLQEEVAGGPINTGDNDILDSVPTWGEFDNDEEDIDFPGETVAVEAGNAGIAIAGKYAFYRVDEAADNRDWNNDGDKGDMVLIRTNLDSLNGSYIAVLDSLPRPAVVAQTGTSSVVGGAFIANEAMAGKDFNDDGDKNDRVVRYFEL